MDIEKQIAYLAEFMLNSRVERIEEVLQLRTRHITVVLEDIYHSPNASAVIRSCECFGIQDLHVIENTKKYSPNRGVVRGAAKWIDIHRYRKIENASENLCRKDFQENDCPTKEKTTEGGRPTKGENNTVTCLSSLKKAGFKIVATTLQNDNALAPDELPLDSPVALCFGTEELGLSETVYNLADYTLKVPMYGFTESFNISVAAALCLQTIAANLRTSQIPWQMTEKERTELRLEWYKKSVRNAGKILKRGEEGDA